jgi:NTP pyrophosphatase (non-canonical NTP hydrolase)
MSKTIAELSKEIHENARDKGFWDKERNLGEMLMLIVSEVAEAMEADRKNDYYNANARYRAIRTENSCKWAFDIVDSNPDAWRNWFRAEVKNTFEDELADACIRIFDLAHARGINLQWHIEQKMRYNATREHMHGKKY